AARREARQKNSESRFKFLTPPSYCGRPLQPAPPLGEEPLFVAHRAAPSCSYGSISAGVARGWNDVAARAALSPSERTRGFSGGFRQSDLSRAPAPSSPGATLYVAHRRRRPRGGSHHAAARQPQGGERVRAEARRLDRGAAQTLAGGGAVRARRRGAAAGRAAR